MHSANAIVRGTASIGGFDLTDAIIISDPLRVPVTAQHLADGRILIRTPGKPPLLLSPTELDRLAAFANDLGVLQRYGPPMAPGSPPGGPNRPDPVKCDQTLDCSDLYML